MAEVNVKYNCGCGYTTDDPEEAIKHVDTKQHTITVLGVIKPKEK